MTVKTKPDLQDHIDKLLDIANSIKINEVTILTGHNGTGKSLIRKTLSPSIGEQLGLGDNAQCCSSTSQELRTGSNPEMGALSGMMRDVAWTPTSTETLNHITQLIKIKDKFIIIDEPEIGMGEETVMGLVNFLNDEFQELKGHGVCVITHNRYIVKHLDADAFHNIEGLTKQEWLDRELIPTDLEQLKEKSNELFRAIQDRINSNKNK